MDERFSSNEDLIPTQPLEASDDKSDLNIPHAPRTDIAWGYLETQSAYFQSAEIRQDKFSFGRGSNQDYHVPKNREVNKLPDGIFNCISRRHFSIERKFDEDDVHGREVLLQDHSMTGTFVNGELVGKDKSRHLVSNDIIAIVDATHPIFK